MLQKCDLCGCVKDSEKHILWVTNYGYGTVSYKCDFCIQKYGTKIKIRK